MMTQVPLGFVAEWLVLGAAVGSPAQPRTVTLHVVVDGDDANPGSAERPLASLGRALARVQGHTEPAEIVIHAGHYPGGLTVGTSDQSRDPVRVPLLIRAAANGNGSFEPVVFEGGRRLTDAKPVPGATGTYRAPQSTKRGSTKRGRESFAGTARKVLRTKDSRPLFVLPGTMVVRQLTNEVITHLDERQAEIAKLRTREDWLARQQHVRATMERVIATLPDRFSPLNPRVTGIVRRDGYRIEKIVYESMPRLYVTGCLLIPDCLQGRAPTILYTAGSDLRTFRGEQWPARGKRRTGGAVYRRCNTSR